MIQYGNSTTKFIKIHSFEMIQELNDSSILMDYENRIAKIEWHGVVDVMTASQILEKAADMIEGGFCDKLLLNREGLKEFSTEARLWIKQDLLMSRAGKLVNNVIKVAAVRSTSTIGNIFANFISTGIQLAFPGLWLSNFDSEEKAMGWLIESVELVG